MPREPIGFSLWNARYNGLFPKPTRVVNRCSFAMGNVSSRALEEGSPVCLASRHSHWFWLYLLLNYLSTFLHPFAPRALPRFFATSDPAATVSSSVDFPGSPVIRPTLLRRFLDGTRTASPVARHALVTVLPLPPRRSDSPHQSDCDGPCCLRPEGEGSASGTNFCRGHLWVHFRCGPVTRSPSRRWLCQSVSPDSFPPLMRLKLRGL